MEKLYNSETNTVDWNQLLKLKIFKDLQNTPQNTIWHQEGNAFIHTCLVTQVMLDRINDARLKLQVGELDRSTFLYKLVKDPDLTEILILSALFHDIGKSVTTAKGEDNEWHCKNHAIEGEKLVSQLLQEYSFEQPERIQNIMKSAISKLVRYHMQPLYILKQRNPEKAILKIVNDLKYVNFEALLFLKECDCMGSYMSQEDNYMETIDAVRKLYYDKITYRPGTSVIVTKLGDVNTCCYTPGQHPNGINKGYQVDGTISAPLTVGVSFYLNGFRTSAIKRIIDKNHFETNNSLYQIENK